MGAKNYKWFLLFLFFHIIICTYGAIAGIAIFLGEKEKIVREGARFINNNTGETVEYTLALHLRFFVSNQEKWFSIVVVICICMAVVLVFFFGYHMWLAINNQTTNENFKIGDCKRYVTKEYNILSAVKKQTEEWTPPKENPNFKMNTCKIDDVNLPLTRASRLKKLDEMMKACIRKKSKLTPEYTPYAPKKSIFKTLSDIWNEK